MITISENTLSHFSVAQTENFIKSVMRVFEEQYGFDVQANLEPLRESIVRQIEKARSYGLVTEKHVFVYILSAVFIDSQFDQHIPQAQKVLTSKTLNADKKAKWLEQFTITLYEELENRGIISAQARNNMNINKGI
jgi:hypothetical protein